MHRLDSGCVADVLFESEIADDFDCAECAVKVIEGCVKMGELPLEKLNPLEFAVIVDCLDGSTFFADSNDAVTSKQITNQKLTAWHKAANELEKQVSEVAGREIYCTRH